MGFARVAHFARNPLAWLVVLALMLLSLLALESTSTGHAPSVIPIAKLAKGTSSHPAAKPTATASPHCTDSNGADTTHNPHCRSLSPG